MMAAMFVYIWYFGGRKPNSGDQGSEFTCMKLEMRSNKHFSNDQ